MKGFRVCLELEALIVGILAFMIKFSKQDVIMVSVLLPMVMILGAILVFDVREEPRLFGNKWGI